METCPLEVPVYVSVQLAPLGQTLPANAQAVRSVDVRISMPGAVAKICVKSGSRSLESRGCGRLMEQEVLSVSIHTQGRIMYGSVPCDYARPNLGKTEAGKRNDRKDREQMHIFKRVVPSKNRTALCLPEKLLCCFHPPSVIYKRRQSLR